MLVDTSVVPALNSGLPWCASFSCFLVFSSPHFLISSIPIPSLTTAVPQYHSTTVSRISVDAPWIVSSQILPSQFKPIYRFPLNLSVDVCVRERNFLPIHTLFQPATDQGFRAPMIYVRRAGWSWYTEHARWIEKSIATLRETLPVWCGRGNEMPKERREGIASPWSMVIRVRMLKLKWQGQIEHMYHGVNPPMDACEMKWRETTPSLTAVMIIFLGVNAAK